MKIPERTLMMGFRSPFTKIGIVVALLAMCAACDSTPGLPEPTEDLFPLTAGNAWAYQQTPYRGDGSPIETRIDSVRAEIIAEATVRYQDQDYRAAVWSWFHPQTNEPTDYQWFYVQGDEGIYTLGGRSSTDTATVKFLRYKYPARAGDQYEVPRLVYKVQSRVFAITDTVTFTVVATDEAFETPAGTFSCYVYHQRRLPEPDVAQPWDYYEYYAPGVGPVGYITKRKTGELVSKHVLYEYRVE